MARTVIESYFRTSKMAAGGHFVQNLKWPEMPSKVNFGHPIWPIDQKWPEMRSKVILGHPKWPPKMARIAIESEFQTSKMADGSHFVKNFPKKKVEYRSEMARNAIESAFWTSKMADGSHFVKEIQKVAYRSEMTRNAIKSEFRISKMGAGGHFVKKFKKNKKSVLI